MRAAAGFHDHPQRWSVSQAAGKCSSGQALALKDAAVGIGECQFEDVLCKIDCDGSSIHGGGLGGRESISSFKPEPLRGSA
jgi:hypothetical protein